MSIGIFFSASRLAEDMKALSRSQAMIWFKPDGTVIDANENFCKTLNYRLSDIVGQHHRLFCDDAIRNSPDYGRFWQDLAAGQFKSGQFLRKRKDARDVWIEASYNPVFRGGKVVRILKIASDITESKNRALEDGNRLTAINLSQALIEFTPDGVILGANDNFLAAMGYQLSEITGKHHSMFCDADYVRSDAYRQFWQNLRGGTFTVDNFARIGKGGRKVWIQAAYTPVQDASGRIYKIIKVASDITSRMIGVETISNSVRRLSEGDLTSQITGTIDPTLEQTRHDFNLAVRSLGQAIGAIKQSAEVLATNAHVINTVSDEIARNAERQAASVEETAAALDEITVTVRDSSARAADATGLVVDTRASAEASGRIVEQATDAMSGIEQSSREIENIISVIDEIAFQTNLLALNAGVEAARAGEAGKGFAVVAQEVRELAQRSASAAQDIKRLISKSSDSVKHGVSLVNDTGRALKTIVQKVQQVDQNVQAIAKASKEQSLGLNEINTAINRLDEGTQKNASTIEEANAASQTLADEAAKLHQLMERFRLPEQAGTPFASTRHRAA
ncbi:methyl-accepting chemotaxis protein [Rhizobium oryzicola]|uniref:PAS domain-containing methyl-accepting chemotaxis protein n=1 Tax=Rhizobium oryzicola TaxID=1232668 RepID=A0ABT8T1G3_9HYPH|nr:PAS domain-containing methyl-accepting chemotaxis protein [Rhizobium oryzicola]MDO1584594.1 PAS domain-containing methyl-accepting chemotaxis protein [Rhizobium oryzicola]